ncbi:hypothetical protein CUJ84_pRLN1000455 (plasmid) [Rhizobium leguminosarum]|uniref:Uncharacterized protein n=1 Tax=Rhizobium leguminosarum TaxID=384 RepID=A0A2K9ZCD9_RHILE|nr:hypothetical protein CUJ84_pRLN1000455 [Rhizobium leguminosarum]
MDVKSAWRLKHYKALLAYLLRPHPDRRALWLFEVWTARHDADADRWRQSPRNMLCRRRLSGKERLRGDGVREDDLRTEATFHAVFQRERQIVHRCNLRHDGKTQTRAGLTRMTV